MDLKKKTTKVNASIVVAVLFFWLAAAAVVWHVLRDPPERIDEQQKTLPVP